MSSQFSSQFGGVGILAVTVGRAFEGVDGRAVTIAVVGAFGKAFGKAPGKLVTTPDITAVVAVFT